MGKKIIISVINDLSTDQRMHKTCNSLVNNGYEVLIIGRNFPAKKILKKEKYQQKRLNCFFNKGFLFYAEYNIRLFLYLLFAQTDALVSVDLDTLLPNYYISKFRNKVLIHDAHEWFSQVPELEYRKNVQKFWSWVERNYYPKLKNAYTVSPGIQDEFKKNYNANFQLIMNVPILKKSPLLENNNENILLYQGAINKGRGLELLINAANKIQAKIQIIGNGDLDAKINHLIKEKKLENKVEKMNSVLPEKLIEYTRNATLGYNILTNTCKSYKYSLPNKFFDYMHAGVPSINSDFPTIRPILSSDQVGICMDYNTQQLAEKINLLLNDKIMLNKLRDNTQKAVLKYNWQLEEAKLITLYKNAFE